MRSVPNLKIAAMLLIAAGAGWTGLAHAPLFSATGPVIAILDGKLLVGEATGHLGGWGTIALHSPSIAGLTCVGEFSATDALGDAGQLRCSDGLSAVFSFQRLTLRRGYGAGASDGSALSFTYGLSAEDSAPYLKLPAGQELRRDGTHLELVTAIPSPPR
jgi:hypothetical protein